MRVDKNAADLQPKVPGNLPAPEYVKYAPCTLAEDLRSSGTCRLIKIHDVTRDPLEPPKFRHKKVFVFLLFRLFTPFLPLNIASLRFRAVLDLLLCL